MNGPRSLRLALIAGAVLTAVTCAPQETREIGRWLTQGRKHSPEGTQTVHPERKRMTPNDLRDQILGAPISDIEYNSRIRPSSRER